MDPTRRCSQQTLTLLALLLRQSRKWRHGYDLSKETGLKSGTLYPLLMRLGERGLLDSKWQDTPEPGRPPRHLYRLTSAGLALAKEQTAIELRGSFLNNPLGIRA